MGRIKISNATNTLVCGEIGRISRVGSFVVELVILSTKMMSSFDLCQVLTRVKFCYCRRQFAYEPSLEIQRYRLQCGRIYEMVKNFRRIHTIACRRQEGKLGGWEILGRCCLRRMECGRIFGHMRFEALGSRSSRLWMRTHHRCVFVCPAAGGGYRHLYSSSSSS